MLVLCVLLSSVAVQAELEGYIVGGSLAAIKDHPHSAALYITCAKNLNGKKARWRCGASIINQIVLLTAAHCINPCEEHPSTVVNLGHENRGCGIVRSEDKYIIHGEYDMNTLNADIALLKLKKPVEFSDKISRVAIMMTPPYMEPAFLAGWGHWNEVNKTRGILLKELSQQVKTPDKCQEVFGELLPTGTICAESFTPTDYGAVGDSGSALIVRSYIQIGITSFKVADFGHHILVYSDVGYYYDWITNNTERLICGDD